MQLTIRTELTTEDLNMQIIDLFLPKSIFEACSFATVNVARKDCFVPSSGNLLSLDNLSKGTPSRSLMTIAFRPLILEIFDDFFSKSHNNSSNSLFLGFFKLTQSYSLLEQSIKESLDFITHFLRCKTNLK